MNKYEILKEIGKYNCTSYANAIPIVIKRAGKNYITWFQISITEATETQWEVEIRCVLGFDGNKQLNEISNEMITFWSPFIEEDDFVPSFTEDQYFEKVTEYLGNPHLQKKEIESFVEKAFPISMSEVYKKILNKFWED